MNVFDCWLLLNDILFLMKQIPLFFFAFVCENVVCFLYTYFRFALGEDWLSLALYWIHLLLEKCEAIVDWFCESLLLVASLWLPDFLQMRINIMVVPGNNRSTPINTMKYFPLGFSDSFKILIDVQIGFQLLLRRKPYEQLIVTDRSWRQRSQNWRTRVLVLNPMFPLMKPVSGYEKVFVSL